MNGASDNKKPTQLIQGALNRGGLHTDRVLMLSEYESLWNTYFNSNPSTLPPQLGHAGEVLTTDGVNADWQPISALQAIDITWTALRALKLAGTLSKGSFYNITDRYNYQSGAIGLPGFLIPNPSFTGDDRGLVYIQALEVNVLSKEVIRIMSCPADYGTLANSIGVWDSTKATSINNTAVWGGRVFINISGIGPNNPPDDFTLNINRWTLITKVSGNIVYVDKQFSAIYDFDNDWFEKQWDGAGNEVGITFNYASNYGFNFNPCDGTDWNMEAGREADVVFANNFCSKGILNNSAAILEISDNRILDAGITNNSSSQIKRNNTGTINSNTTNIINNNNSSSITSNLNIGAIENNLDNAQAIYDLPNTVGNYNQGILYDTLGDLFSIDITGLTTLNLTAVLRRYLKRIVLTSTNATETINAFSNYSSISNIIIRPEVGLAITFVHGIGAGQPRLEGAINAVIDGTTEDFLEIELSPLGAIQQINIGTY